MCALRRRSHRTTISAPPAPRHARFAWVSTTPLPTHLAHPLQDDRGVVIHALGPPFQGRGQNRGELSCLLSADIPGRSSIVVRARRLCAINTRTPFDNIQVDLQDALLAQDQFGHRHKCGLCTFAEDRATRSEEQVFDELLRQRGSSSNATSFQVFFSSDLYLVPIEPMMLVKARILCGDYRMLEIGRYLAERNEFVSFPIGGVVNPGLQTAFGLHGGGRRVDPPEGHKKQRGKQPKKQ